MIVLPTLPLRNPNVGLVYHRDLFSAADCAKILGRMRPDGWKARAAPIIVAPGTGTSGRSEQALPIDKSGYPLGPIIGEICNVNASGWRFELTGIVSDDMPRVVRDRGEGSAARWRLDIGETPVTASRKLSFVVQLSGGTDYAGGDLAFYNVALDRTAIRKAGTIIIFPAYWSHRTEPVTSGTRHAITGWIHGASYK